MMRSAPVLVALAFLAAACGRPTTNDQQARVRNQPPATCTQEQFNQCPALETRPCDDGSEPVIDYDYDCCPHFTCQPLCVAPEPCPLLPAPHCPPGTELWIGTALEDCCPAYQCRPGAGTACDQERASACPPALPYCGPNVEPMVVGYTGSCCPIYQCPCVDAYGEQADAGYCGCTYPVCLPDEQVVCQGGCQNCTCLPAAPNCVSDYDCGPYMWCDLSQCIGMSGCAADADCPVGVACVDGQCMPANCNSDDPNYDCAGGTACLGVCRGNATSGCQADNECPSGQRCEMQCSGWGCVSQDGSPCANCDASDPTCTCEADGSCQGAGDCVGYCVPATACDPMYPPPPAACPQPPMPCTDPLQTGVDPATCCPIFECPSCQVAPSGAGEPCPVESCPGGIQTGYDQNCCPIVCCPDAAGNYPCLGTTACRTDADCAAGQSCQNGVCVAR